MPPSRTSSQRATYSPVVTQRTIHTEDAPATDQCVRDAARYGFCEHTILQASLGPNHYAAAPLWPPRWRQRHPHLHELRATAAFAGLLALGVYLIRLQGLLGIALFAGIGLGWLLLYAWGLPKWFTHDPRQLIPVDARDRIYTPRMRRPSR